jgi:hypothetical protein
MKNKMISSIILAIVGLFLLSVLFTGCISNNNSNKAADVKLEGFSHHETFELPTWYISSLSFTFQNTGNANAKNVSLYIYINDNIGSEVYNKELILNSTLGPNEENVQSIDVPYYLENLQLNVDITISWDGGTNHYNKTFKPKFKEYADVLLESITHHESYNPSNGYTSKINFLIQNRGNIIADNVKIHVIVKNNNGNEDYNKEENVASSLISWEVKNYNITIPFEFYDISFNLSIIITWDGGMNHYTRSIEPEFIEYADVNLESMTHYEHYKLFVGYTSIVNFIFQNKGSKPADNVEIHITAYDTYGDEIYNDVMPIFPQLIPGEIESHEIIVPYDFNDTSLYIYVTIVWDGGSNNYSESFEPRILF